MFIERVRGRPASMPMASGCRQHVRVVVALRHGKAKDNATGVWRVSGLDRRLSVAPMMDGTD